jgi:hypothetical protein
MDPSRTILPTERKRLMKRYLWARSELEEALEGHVVASQGFFMDGAEVDE